jgi:SAM-dependent methyltransferase
MSRRSKPSFWRPVADADAEAHEVARGELRHPATSFTVAAVFEPNLARIRVLLEPKPDARVLDVGGWASPFNRANWVLDSEPYDTRGYYGKVGLPPSQGWGPEQFTRERWVQRDICAREPWPFEDKFFDLAVCSQTLEDVRDPLFVCSELLRVARAGYIETPSRVAETCRGWESRRIAGLSHHRWLVDISGNHVQFTMKYHIIHEDFELSFPPAYFRRLKPEDRIAALFWEGSFTFGESLLHGPAQREDLRRFVAERFAHPRRRFLFRAAARSARRITDGLGRRLWSR